MTVEEEQGLDALYQDIQESELPGPELLARYVDDPESLSADERRLVETARDRSPVVADELATLRNVDMSVFQATEAEPPETIARVIPLRRRVFAQISAPRVALALAATLAALAIWFTGVQPPGDEAPRMAEREPVPVEEEAPLLDPRTPVSGPRTETQLAERPPEPQVPDVPQVPQVQDPQDETTPKPSRQIAETEEEAEPAERSTEPSPLPADPPGQILIAMAMPSYAAPTGSEIWDPGASAYRSDGSSETRLTALSPQHLARATHIRPSLYWHLASLPDQGAFYLTVLDENSDEEIAVDQALPAPRKPGLQEVDLAALGIELPPARALRWSVALRPEPESPPAEFVFGWIEAAAPGANTGGCSDDLPLAERPAACAGAGYWYDALGATMELRRLHPESDQPVAALRRLLADAGLDDIGPL